MPKERSTKPYLIRAICEWCADNALSPYLAVKVNAQTRVPMSFVKNGEIVLNVSASATRHLTIDNDDEVQLEDEVVPRFFDRGEDGQDDLHARCIVHAVSPVSCMSWCSQPGGSFGRLMSTSRPRCRASSPGWRAPPSATRGGAGRTIQR